MNVESVSTFNPEGFFPERDNDVTVIIEESKEFDFPGTRMGFRAPLTEPVFGFVSITLAVHCKRAVISSIDSVGNDFELIRWDPAGRELYVKLVKNAFGIKKRQ